MTVTAMAFLRRWVQHILPRGFVRIRQTGFLANPCRRARVVLARQLLTSSPPALVTTPAIEPATRDDAPRATWPCPHCGATMVVGRILSALQLATLTWSFDTS
jgi:hypothetical protein